MGCGSSKNVAVGSQAPDKSVRNARPTYTLLANQDLQRVQQACVEDTDSLRSSVQDLTVVDNAESSYKVIVVGPSGCGKTSFITRLMGSEVHDSYVPTSSVDHMHWGGHNNQYQPFATGRSGRAEAIGTTEFAVKLPAHSKLWAINTRAATANRYLDPLMMGLL